MIRQHPRLLALSFSVLALQSAVAAQSDPQGITDLHGQALFAGTDAPTGTELWAIPLGGGVASLVADMNPGPALGLHSGDPEAFGPIPLYAVEMGDSLYYFAYTNEVISLWRSDGTPAGTTKLREFDQIGGSPFWYGYYFRGVSIGDKVLFQAYTTDGGFQLWASDGTAAGTTVVGELAPSAYGRLGNEGILAVLGPVDSTLWKSDGTPGGTSQLALIPAPGEIDWDTPLVTARQKTFFRADDGTTGFELWVTDGTPAGTGMVADIFAGPTGSDPDHFTAIGDVLYFSADDGVNGRELWRSDGTAAGTSMVVDLYPGFIGSSPEDLVAVGDRLFFAREESSKTHIYTVEDGVVKLGATLVTTSGSAPGVKEIAAVGSRRVFFQSNVFPFGAELWSSDGTPGGTALFADLLAVWSSVPEEITLAGGVLYATHDDSNFDRVLYQGPVGATADPFGAGCSATGLLPELRIDDPVLGGTIEIAVEGAVPASSGSLYVGTPGTPVELSPGCWAYAQLTTAVPILSLTIDATGAWTYPTFPIPAIPGLAGFQLTVQAALAPPGSGVDVSNGVLLTFGA